MTSLRGRLFINRIRNETRKLTAMAMMLALIVTLSVLDHMLPPLPFLPPNVRLGLSNIVTMYALFFLGKRPAFLLAVLKSLFVVLTRGFLAGLLSVGGGMISLLTIILLATVFRSSISGLLLSVAGAISHNIGQMLIAGSILEVNMVAYYFPFLIISGILMGSVTGILLRVVMPLFQKRIAISGSYTLTERR